MAGTESKVVPLKVVHIFSPRIFRTDAHNFRSLVQCLTGNKRHLCDDSSWIPLGCVELTPRKRITSAWNHCNNDTLTLNSPTCATVHQTGLLDHDVDDFVSGLISSDAPLPDIPCFHQPLQVFGLTRPHLNQQSKALDHL